MQTGILLFSNLVLRLMRKRKYYYKVKSIEFRRKISFMYKYLTKLITIKNASYTG